MTSDSIVDGDDVRLAVAAILVAVLALSLGDAMIKALSLAFPLWQLFVLRSLIAIPALVLCIRIWRGSTSLWPRQPGWVALRSLLLTFQWIAYYAALPLVELSVAGAAYYTLPLFITLFAALFGGDRIGFTGWLAIITGFTGVLVMLRPGAADFNSAALLPLVAAVLYALAMVLTRTRCMREDPLVLALGLHVSMFATGAVASALLPLVSPAALEFTGNTFIFGGWTAMGAVAWLAMGGLALAAVLGSAGGALAYQRGAPATVAAFDYAYLAFVTLWGILFFAEVPGGWTLAGMGLIVAAGVLAVRRR